MICLICRQAELRSSLVSMRFARDEVRLELRAVPANVCPNCAEAIVEEPVALRLLHAAEGLSARGEGIRVCDYQDLDLLEG
ncbi:MAG TPA: YgiT-type zinc finger protein [Anaerolineales bacterium]|jgi:YgiT-type zinc finger domain-containing protein